VNATRNVLLLIPGCLTIDPGAGWFARGKRAWAGCYLVTENILSCNKVFVIYPRPEQTGSKKEARLSERALTEF
jgi:hypothetical protein